MVPRMRLNAACIHTLPVVLRNDMAVTCTYVRTLCLTVTYKDYDLSVLQYGGERNALRHRPSADWC
jgi:hypothetical protein